MFQNYPLAHLHKLAKAVFMGWLIFLSIVAQAQVPTITTFQPQSGPIGSSITIKGTNLRNPTTVTIGGVGASIISSGSDSIVVSIMSGSTKGKVRVTTMAGTFSTTNDFIITPTIAFFSPLNAKPGDLVNITGTGFSTIASSNVVYFGATQATILGATSTNIQVIVPVGATYGPIRVTNIDDSLSCISSGRFTPVFSPIKDSLGEKDFAHPEDIDGSGFFKEFKVGDLNGDQKPDIVGVAESLSGVTALFVFRNSNSVGSWISQKSSYALFLPDGTYFYPNLIELADINGDGRSDIVMADLRGNIQVLLNTSNSSSITFSHPFTFNTATAVSTIAVADLDGDGKPDIITGNGRGLRNTSRGNQISFSEFSFPLSILNNVKYLFGDLNGDSKLDIISFVDNCPQGALGSAIRVFKNTSTVGSISFVTVRDLGGMYRMTDGDLGDIDGDGKLDIIISSADDIFILRNTSLNNSVSFSPLNSLDNQRNTYPPFSLADLDGDGKVDVISGLYTLEYNKNISSSGNLVFKNGLLYFGSGGSSTRYIVADLDGDSKPEILYHDNLWLWILRQITPPEIKANVSLATFKTCAGKTSNTQSFTVNGSNLTDNITITAPAGYEISENESSFTSSLILIPTNGVVSNTKLYIRMTGSSAASGDVSISSNNANTYTFTVNGAFSAPGIFSYTSNNLYAKGQNITNLVPTLSGCAASTYGINPQLPAGLSFNENTGIISGTPTMVTPQTTYTVTATNSGGNTSVTVSITIYEPPPFISAFSPIRAKPGDLVNITGTGFGTTSASNTVYFGATKANVLIASATSLVVQVPIGATYAPIGMVNTNTGLACHSLKMFNPLYSPAKTSITASDFAPKQDFSTGDYPRSIVLGDLDGDGKPDMVYANNLYGSIAIARNTAVRGSIDNNSFSTPVNIIPQQIGFAPLAVALGDVDGDGKQDLVFTDDNNHEVYVLRNLAVNGNITNSSFGNLQRFALPGAGNALSLADIDGDGKLDIVVADIKIASNNTVSVLRNLSTSGGGTPNISFGQPISFTTAFSPKSIAIGDLDGDGKPDLALAGLSNSGPSSVVSVLRNTSSLGNIPTISFAPSVEFATGLSPNAVVIGDIDGDGKLDMVTANSGDGNLSIFRNTATSGTIDANSFATALNSYTTEPAPQNVAFGDLDGDGKPDLAVSSGGANKISLFRNSTTNSGIAFDAKIDLDAGNTPMSLVIGDLDGDGKPDIATTNNNGNTISVFQNLSFISINASLNAFVSCAGTASAEQSFTVSGTILSDNITLTAPTGFELSTTSGSGFGNSITLVPNSGTVAATTVYVRMAATATGTPGGNISVASTGAATQNIAVSGTVNALPTIGSFSPASGPIGTVVTITGTNLSNPDAVMIGGVAAIVISSSNTSLVAMVMPGAVTGVVSVTKLGCSVNSTSNFTIAASKPPNAQQGNKLLAADAASGGARQGYSVSISADGNTAIVGGTTDGMYGAAYIFTRNAGVWSQQGSKLVGTGATINAQQGNAVCISADGNTAIVAGYNDNNGQGAAWVYTRNAGVWLQQGSKLVGTGAVGAAYQGTSVSLSADGNTAVLGGEKDNADQGAVWVFTRSAGVWSQQGSKLVGTGNTGAARQGHSISLSADASTLIVGGDRDNGSQGAVWVFTQSAGVWSQQGGKLVASDIQSGFQGTSVAINADGNTAIVGAWLDNFNQGAACVFTRTAGIWSQQGSKLVGTGVTGFARQGTSVSINADGNIAIVGGKDDNGGVGAAWVYTRTNGAWVQQGNKLVGSGNVGNASQGSSSVISANGSTALVGGWYDNIGRGAVWVFATDPTIITTGNMNAFSACIGSVSAEQSFSVRGINLTANITLTAPTGFELSTTSGSGFGNAITLVHNSGTVAATTVYVRMAATATGTPGGNISVASIGAATQNFSVSGTVNVLPTIGLGTINAVATTATTFHIPYTGTTGSPNQYSVTAVNPSLMPFFTAITNASLSNSPVTVPIPASAANNYTFTLTVRNSITGCTSSQGITLSVVQPPSGLSYSTPNVFTRNTTINSLSPTVTGTVTNYSISPSLPAGLSLNSNTGVISGTPTAVSAQSIYTVTASNSGGSTTAAVSITVNEPAPSGLSYPTPNVFTRNTTINSLSPTVTGTVTTYSISPSLPTGLQIDNSTGIIFGTPLALSAPSNYTITASNTGGSTTANVNIAVNDLAPFNLRYTENNVYTINTSTVNLVPTISGGIVITYAVQPSLPSGLVLNPNSGVISGKPTALSAQTNYTITATNSGGSVSTNLSITVNDIAPSGLSYPTPNLFTRNTTINNLSPTVTGTVTSYSISPSLPAGLSLNSNTGMISGTPTSTTAQAIYTITASNSGGSVSTNLSITVNDIAPASLSYPTNNVFTRNTAIANLVPTITGGAVVSYSISPALPLGLTINTATGIIFGTPLVVSPTTTYTITATNSGGSVQAGCTITVNDIGLNNLIYTAQNVFTKGTTINQLVPIVSGGVVVSFSISPALPAGLSLNTNTGVISGVPTVVSAQTNYTVTAVNSGGSTTAVFSITVNDIAPSNLQYTPASQTIRRGNAIVAMVPASSGGQVVLYSIQPSLPTGLSLNSITGVINGIPSMTSPLTTYTVTATNSGGATTATINITVNDTTTSLVPILFDNIAVRIYPNPVVSITTVDLGKEPIQAVTIMLTDGTGSMVRKWVSKTRLTQLSLDGVVAGVYWVRIVLGTKSVVLPIIKS